MITRTLLILLGVAMVVAATLTTVQAPKAAAQGCPDVEVIFARGTVEPAPPMGLTGLAFVEALRSQLPGRSVAAHAVNYPASGDFSNRLAFAQTVVNGVDDAQARVKYLAATCKRTDIVLGGYSQGAVVAGYAANAGIALPPQYARYTKQIPPPLPAAAASQVAAIVMFGPPSDRFLRDVGAPPIRIEPGLAARTKRYCIPGDTICNGAPVGQPNALHVLYTVNGMTLDAARYVVGRL
ncbi:cutinase family protein [Gordonia insulae]|uniref:Putative cutinase n=1 Tax=Gordonia insulae TaxID=2420509 RepID=A0A3G8JHD5_9ACTN|nr:cutinase family protein [Gordonia insulae]AZG44507.1 putative cutinase [Gordonia insulae]